MKSRSKRTAGVALIAAAVALFTIETVHAGAVISAGSASVDPASSDPLDPTSVPGGTPPPPPPPPVWGGGGALPQVFGSRPDAGCRLGSADQGMLLLVTGLLIGMLMVRGRRKETNPVRTRDGMG